MGIAAVGFFGTSTSRLRRGATMVSGATRLAYAHATATSKTVRLIFNFGTSTIRMEETKDRHLMKDPLLFDAANEAEAEALAASDATTLRTPPASFDAVNLRKASGMRWGRDEEEDEDNPELELPRDIQFWQIDVEHQAEPVNEGLAYLYFFPGGQTENASIQLRIANTDPDSKTGFLSVLVSPLTGKVNILGGRVDAPKPRDDIEASEVEDPGR